MALAAPALAPDHLNQSGGSPLFWVLVSCSKSLSSINSALSVFPALKFGREVGRRLLQAGLT